ncbi:camphor resistance protein CrcB [Homoserinimonas aerilata]|uniref:Fluoride-specific ion channel FluC n=1 Tax=Homoserinimonas aerilata TaxID=1162970 RepID=A0A542YKX6_9MICO|nr:fluoride efflux transporter CrcB [Homoserinimonas aerilata]TQL48574.1 camphor resistance protein CrcB [Homoserinimonas aerilata]
MTPLLFVLVSVAGGLGAACRLLVDGALRPLSKRMPAGTWVVNVSGSLLLGLLTGLAIAGTLPAEWHLVLGAGFLGGYTTFSTASFETVRMLQQRRPLAAVANGLGMLAASTLAAGLGLWAGALIAG